MANPTAPSITGTSGSAVPANRAGVLMAWGILLLGSLLPDILFNQFTGTIPSWLGWAKLALFAGLFLAGLAVKALQPLRPFAAVLFTMYAAQIVLAGVNFSLPFLQALLGNGGFIHSMQPEQTAKLAASVLMIAVLFLLGYRRKDMFLTLGNLKAPIAPVKWMGFPKPSSWVSFGGQYSVYLALGVGAVIWLTSGATPALVGRSLPQVAAILVMAALNAFNEEMIYRSAVLTTLEGPAGRQQAWLMAAALFGIGHFFGAPSGWVGICLATFMGWVLSKAMLETRGFFWSWWIHFLQDVVIFFFLAGGMVTPGG